MRRTWKRRKETRRRWRIPRDDAAPEPFSTPGQKTIDDLVKFTGAARQPDDQDAGLRASFNAPQPTAGPLGDPPPQEEGEMVVILLRGDHMVSDTKLATVLGTDTFRPSTPEEAHALLGSEPGLLWDRWD